MQMIGVIPAMFSLLPVFLTVAIGRFNDSGGTGRAIAAGALVG